MFDFPFSTFVPEQREVIVVCYHPLDCYYPGYDDHNGKRYLEFNSDKLPKGLVVDGPKLIDPDSGVIEYYHTKIPCGKCIGCRLDYSRSWAIRSVHESMLHDKNCFVTLTFDDEHLPINKSLNKAYMSSWLKRFRKKFGEGIRFLMCGEYGEKFKRPHYHILFYNFDFPDRKFWTTRHGQIYYRSPMLEEIWRDACAGEGNGYSVIGDVSFESSAYVSRYVTKKFKSPDDEEVKKYYNGREPEFLHMSRMPGLGYDFIVKNYKQILGNGYVVLPNGHKAPVPLYYSNIVKDYDPGVYEKFKLDRLKYMLENYKEVDDETQQRQEALEELQNLKLDTLVRSYEIDMLLHNI